MLTIDREARASVATCHGRKMILSRYGHTFRWLSGNRAQLILTSAVEHVPVPHKPSYHSDSMINPNPEPETLNPKPSTCHVCAEADIRRHCWLEEEVRTKEVKARQPGF